MLEVYPQVSGKWPKIYCGVRSGAKNQSYQCSITADYIAGYDSVSFIHYDHPLPNKITDGTHRWLNALARGNKTNHFMLQDIAKQEYKSIDNETYIADPACDVVVTNPKLLCAGVTARSWFYHNYESIRCEVNLKGQTYKKNGLSETPK